MTSTAGSPERLDLRAFDLRAGEATVTQVTVPASQVVLGGSTYELSAGEPARVEITHAHTGWHLRLRVTGQLSGPCWRCLEHAELPLRADVSEFCRFDRPTGASFDEDLDSEYVSHDGLDALGMANDALLDGVPNPILCRPDCAGLCPHCGAALNDAPCGCVTEAVDSRWDALREVAARLDADDPDR